MSFLSVCVFSQFVLAQEALPDSSSVSQSRARLCAIVSRISGRDEASHPFASEKTEGAHVLQVHPSSPVVAWSEHFHKRIHSLHQRFEVSSRRLVAAAKS